MHVCTCLYVPDRACDLVWCVIRGFCCPRLLFFCIFRLLLVPSLFLFHRHNCCSFRRPENLSRCHFFLSIITESSFFFISTVAVSFPAAIFSLSSLYTTPSPSALHLQVVAPFSLVSPHPPSPISLPPLIRPLGSCLLHCHLLLLQVYTECPLS